MKKTIYLIAAIYMIASISHASPLLWRSAKTIPGGKPIFMVGLSYSTTDKRYDWDEEEWTDISEEGQTDVIGSHFMLGYAPIDKWEAMVHIPIMYKSRDTLSTLGWQDIWVKTRYNFIGGKKKPYLTGVAAVRIPVSSDDVDILLDDQTLDFALGALFMHTVHPVVLHLKAGYWYNTKKDVTEDIQHDVGDEIEGILKVDYVFNNRVKAFLNLTWVETFKTKEDGNEIDDTEKRRFTVSPGIVINPIKGLSVRPKFIYPVEAINKGGNDFSWKIGLDTWYVP